MTIVTTRQQKRAEAREGQRDILRSLPAGPSRHETDAFEDMPNASAVEERFRAIADEHFVGAAEEWFDQHREAKIIEGCRAVIHQLAIFGGHVGVGADAISGHHLLGIESRPHLIQALPCETKEEIFQFMAAAIAADLLADDV